MIRLEKPISFKSISGFVYQQDMIEVMNIMTKGLGVVPPCFVFVKKEPIKGRTGFYAAFNVQLNDEDIEKLKDLMDDFMVGDL